MGDPGDTTKPFELSFWKFLARKLCVLVGGDPVVYAVPCSVQRLPCFEKELAARQFTSTVKKECMWQRLACCYAVLRQNASSLFALQTTPSLPGNQPPRTSYRNAGPPSPDRTTGELEKNTRI
jgi:hypothetical protein